tara:strand:- start:476 stop:769 length:294 start_codon:yes stop_codon:yes gene_type:complete
MDNHTAVLIGFIALAIIGKIADWALEERESRKLRVLVNEILEQALEEEVTEENVYLEMEVVKEALIEAYEMEDYKGVKYLGDYLNALRAIKYNIKTI